MNMISCDSLQKVDYILARVNFVLLTYMMNKSFIPSHRAGLNFLSLGPLSESRGSGVQRSICQGSWGLTPSLGFSFSQVLIKPSLL